MSEFRQLNDAFAAKTSRDLPTIQQRYQELSAKRQKGRCEYCQSFADFATQAFSV